MKMLEIYEKMYEDICTTTPEIKSIELIKLSVAAELELVKASDLPGDRKYKISTEAIEKGRTKMYDVILRSQDPSKQGIYDETENISQKKENLKTGNSKTSQASEQ